MSRLIRLVPLALALLAAASGCRPAAPARPVVALVMKSLANEFFKTMQEGAERFVEVHVSTCISVCEGRDPKGLYSKARAGQIKDFTGISAPYEPPEQPDIAIDTGAMSIEEATRALYDHLARRMA